MTKKETVSMEREETETAEVSVDEQTAETAQSAGDPFERRWSKRETAKSTASPEIIGVAEGEAGSALEAERNRANELHDRLQRSMADLSNYRKRVEAEREEMAKLASMLLVAELLPVLDNFERAMSTIPTELEQFSWLQGIALIGRHLQAILEREGILAIEAVGTKFNPSLHEAIVEDETTDAEPGTVTGELQRG
ncbi:MAG TPA: nucleotide exchange factor GrpE [Chloroflexota bacterium]|jgi:molecular chaperone GrpE|nr:nucleotide exchange factor GrpE [Chloroflexota bacterium]